MDCRIGRGGLDIAVIGAGVAGLSAAWLLSRRYRVTLYERESRLGGHSHTVEVAVDRGAVPVDAGFIVYNERNYPNLAALFAALGVATGPSDMSFSVSVASGRLEYAGSPAGLFAQPGNLVRPRHWRMVADIARFYATAARDLASGRLAGLALGDYLAARGFGAAFVDDHLLPMGAAIWSAPLERMRGFPAESFVRFFDNHGLLKLAGRPRWRTVAGGSRCYVERLRAAMGAELHLGVGARRIHRDGAGAVVEDGRGARRRFDHVVLATHADQALALLADAAPEERRVLGAFGYQPNRAVVHSDKRLMPRRRAAWASWNYRRDGAAGAGGGASVTYWMNRLQRLPTATPLFVSLNPTVEPRPDLVHHEIAFEHPVFDRAALDAQGALAAIQGRRRVWFCGSYTGYGFHEDALVSGLAVAEALGGVVPPWRQADAVPLPARDPRGAGVAIPEGAAAAAMQDG